MDTTRCFEKLINILNLVSGRFKDSASYIFTLGSALFGLVSDSRNAAIVGGIIIPRLNRKPAPRSPKEIPRRTPRNKRQSHTSRHKRNRRILQIQRKIRMVRKKIWTKTNLNS
jgi:hypothetical protein